MARADREHIPVAAGLGGGSSDAATALTLANETLPEPLLQTSASARLRRSSAPTCPSFSPTAPNSRREPGPSFGNSICRRLLDRARAPTRRGQTVDGRRLRRVRRAARFRRAPRRTARSARRIQRPTDLAALPQNDLASSPLADELRAPERSAQTSVAPVRRSTVSSFDERDAAAAARSVSASGRVWITAPAWYG